MDWMGEKLRDLIAEGQKALGKEVVVYAEDAEADDGGFIDDGAEGWADDAAPVPGAEPTTPRRRGHRSLAPSPSVTSPIRPTFLESGSWAGPSGRSRGRSFNTLNAA